MSATTIAMDAEWIPQSSKGVAILQLATWEEVHIWDLQDCLDEGEKITCFIFFLYEVGGVRNLKHVKDMSSKRVGGDITWSSFCSHVSN